MTEDRVAGKEFCLPPFDRDFLSSENNFSVIGEGAIGGKAHGLALVTKMLADSGIADEFKRIEIVVPRLTVITTDFFDQFMEQNNLYEIALSDATDERIAHEFQKAELPAMLVGDLYALTGRQHEPLAIRSSSLLEDAKHEPFAGIYATKMIPNNQSDTKKRFQKLVEAIKFVYASTFFTAAKEYMFSTGHDLRSEKMAVIIQEVVGRTRNKRFYPNLAGVARSYNYYAFGKAKPEDGVVSLALGLGRIIVDEGISWSYCPRLPRANPPYTSITQLMKDSQISLWAIDMAKTSQYDPIKETEYMVKCDLDDAEYDDTLRHISSTYDGASDRLVMGTNIVGPRVINFSPILSANVYPLNKMLQRLLQLAEDMVGSEVEIEFAMNFAEGDKPARFGFLQVRPMVVCGEAVDVSPEDLSGDTVLVSSQHVLGNGEIPFLKDIVYVRPEAFEAKHTPAIAQQLAQINRGMVNSKTPYLLIGFGRWGSADPWLGIPVTWGQISAAKVMVEATLENMNVELSQGSHFFHNISSFQVSYFSTRHHDKHIQWDWLNQQPAVFETELVRHVQLPCCLTVRVDGRSGRGVITR